MSGCPLPGRTADAVVAIIVATTLGFLVRVGDKPDGMARRNNFADLAIRGLVPKVMNLLLLCIAKVTLAVFVLGRIGAHWCPLLASVVGRLVGRLEGDAHFARLRPYGLFGSAEFEPHDSSRCILIRQLADLAFVAARPSGSVVSCRFAHCMLSVPPAIKGCGHIPAVR